MALFHLEPEVLATQRCYRALLNALARPGTLPVLGNARIGDGGPRSLPSALRTVLATLLDEQASLAVYGADAPGWAEEIGDITGVRLTTVETADYWLCSGVPPVEMLAALKQGSLLAPEEGATALVWLGSPIPGQAGRARISGPGVASTACLAVSSPLLQTIEHRLAVPFEYPMGFDLFIVDSEGRVLGLPRTSNVDLFMDGEG